MADIQAHRTQRVRNDPAALAKHRLRMANSYWRRIAIESTESPEMVRVKYGRMFDRKAILDEIAKEGEE